MTKFKELLVCLFTRKPNKERSWTIQCKDCGSATNVVMPNPRQMNLPDGWLQVWVGLKAFYICDKCAAKRREWAKQLLKHES